MSFFGKVFKFHNSENQEDFINSLGLPADKVQFFVNFKPDQKIEKTGDDTYVYTITTPEGDKSLPFTSGVEFEDKRRDVTLKNKFTVNGNKVTHIMEIDSDLTITAKKEFSSMKMVEKLTNSKWDGTATITYNV